VKTPQMIVLPHRRGPRLRAEAPTFPVPVRLSPAERERVRVAAQVNFQTVSQFIRDAVVTAAEDCLETRNTQ
jgi:uncharacterized protein (DUF1778 family)